MSHCLPEFVFEIVNIVTSRLDVELVEGGVNHLGIEVTVPSI
jgi:hypothetical protein